jgi:CRP-like cAMP-binding protein
MENLERILRQHPFLEGLTDAQLAFMVGCAKNVVFDEGQVLFREGEVGNELFLVREGRVGLELVVPPRGRCAVETVEAGDIIGWSWLFPPYRWHCDARARDKVRAIRFDGACLRPKLDEDTALGFALTKKLLAAAHRRLERVRLQRIDAFGGQPA